MSQQNFNDIWASDSGALKATPSDNKMDAGWLPEAPPADYQNYLQNRIDQQLQYLEQHGIPEWLTTITYPQYAVVVGTDGLIYKSLSAGNTGNDPVTDGGVNWFTQDTGLISVSTDSTIDGDGTSGSPLSIDNNSRESAVNLVINPDFSIDQREGNYIGFSPDGSYTYDRWRAQTIGTSTVTLSKNAAGNFLYTMDTVGTSVLNVLEQSIENENGFLDNKDVTVSVKFKESTGAQGAILLLNQAGVFLGAVDATETLEIKHFTYSGLPTGQDFFQIRLQLNAPIAGQYLEIEWVKLEVEDTNTPFEKPDYTTELLECQRYYFNYPESRIIQATADSSAEHSWNVTYNAEMRATPTVTFDHVIGSGITISDASTKGCIIKDTEPSVGVYPTINNLVFNAELT